MMKGHHDDRMIETIVYLLNFVHWLHFIYALMEVQAKMSVSSDAMFGISAGNIKNENIERATAFRIEYKHTHSDIDAISVFHSCRSMSIRLYLG